SYSVKGSLNNNDQFNIIEKSGSWYKISKGNLEGYTSGDYVQILEYGNNSSNNSGTESKPNDTNKPNTDNSQTNQSNGKVVYTNYNMSLNEYVRIQHERVPKYSTDYFEGYINPDKAQNQYQFLRVDKFRNINASALDAYLEKSDAGVLKGQSNAFISAAKNYSIDPLYFVAQSIHETGYGKSILAKGVTITEIADMSKEKYNDKGQLIGYEMIKLSKPTIVYNLYGIGAYDNSNVFPNRALIAGTTYAYNKGWTSVSKAISGAAEFVSTNYINSSKYEQNTLYKMRYMHNNQYIWHQYATSPWYAQSIGEQISNMAYMYSNKNDLLYDKPKFTQGRANTINIVPKVNKNTLKQSEINSPIDDGQIQ
uniref:N-acetylglucosaminidase n=1 Tax=uncultured Clostridium sp. TaxID=59620 RepID=UPI00258EB2A6